MKWQKTKDLDISPLYSLPLPNYLNSARHRYSDRDINSKKIHRLKTLSISREKKLLGQLTREKKYVSRAEKD